MDILNLLFINLIVVLIHESGFIANLDGWVSDRYRFHHLPHIFLCALCQTWWLSILYIILVGKFNILWILFSIVNAHLTKITQPLYRLLENAILKVIEAVNRLL